MNWIHIPTCNKWDQHVQINTRTMWWPDDMVFMSPLFVRVYLSISVMVLKRKQCESLLMKLIRQVLLTLTCMFCELCWKLMFCLKFHRSKNPKLCVKCQNKSHENAIQTLAMFYFWLRKIVLKCTDIRSHVSCAAWITRGKQSHTTGHIRSQIENWVHMFINKKP